MEIEGSDKSVIKDVENTVVRRNCDICNVHDIHINDFKNHEKGRKHQSKCREEQDKSSLEGNDSHDIKCVYCNRGFTDNKYYTIHLGTKTHRRNLKKLGVKDESHPDSIKPTEVTKVVKKGRKLGTLIDEIPVDGRWEKYKSRKIKGDGVISRSYIYSLTAYLSLRLALDQNVKDFMISVNDKDWGVFGDLIIRMIYKDKNIMYAVQCKKVNQSFRQISSLEEAKLHVEKQYDRLAKLKDTVKDITNIRFVIFTTYSTSSNFCKSVPVTSKVLNKWKVDGDILNDATIELKPLTKKNDIINVTSDRENVYSFLLNDKINCQLPYIYFYTNQRVVPSMLNQLLKLRFDNYPDISNDYIKYIENWGEGKLGGSYKLRKNDIVLQLGQILLSPYIISPKKIRSKHDNFDIWNSVIDKVDVTVVKNEPFIISKICQPLNKLVEEQLATNIDTITKSISLKNGTTSIMDYVEGPIKHYLCEVIQDLSRDQIPLSLIYKVFWKAGIIPLLLSSENQEECKGFIFDVILFMKQMGVNKKFLLKSAELNNLNRCKEHLKIFSCLEDIINYELVNLDEITIRVSDYFSLSLSMIHSTDPFFFKGVTPNMFFDISLGRYSLKPSYGGIPKKKDELKIILSDEVKKELEDNLYARTELLRMNSSSYLDQKLRGIHPCLF